MVLEESALVRRHWLLSEDGRLLRLKVVVLGMCGRVVYWGSHGGLGRLLLPRRGQLLHFPCSCCRLWWTLLLLKLGLSHYLIRGLLRC